MASKKCPRCSYTTDDESISVCPECEAELEYDCVLNAEDGAEEVTEEAAESAETAEEVAEYSEYDFDADYNYQDEDSEDDFEQDEYDESDEKKSGKGFKIAITVLIILIFFGVVYIGATIWANDNGAISSFSYSEKDVPGVYAVSSGQYEYNFVLEPMEIEVKEGGEEVSEKDSVSESDAGSDAEAPKAEPKLTKQTFHGQYNLTYSAKAVREQVMLSFVQSSQDYIDSYIQYAQSKGLSNSELDLEGFIKANKLEEALSDFDAENNVTKSFRSEPLESGVWRYTNGKVELADQNGSIIETFDVTSKGLVNPQSYFKGSSKPGSGASATYEIYIEDMETTQKVTLYDDGNVIIRIIPDDTASSTSSIVGTYEIKDGILSLTYEGGKSEYTVLDDGFAIALKKK